MHRHCSPVYRIYPFLLGWAGGYSAPGHSNYHFRHHYQPGRITVPEKVKAGDIIAKVNPSDPMTVLVGRPIW